MRQAAETKITGEAAIACCGLIVVYVALTALALAVAITDMVGGRTHLTLDIVLLVVFGLPYVASTFRRAS